MVHSLDLTEKVNIVESEVKEMKRKLNAIGMKVIINFEIIC